MSARNTILLKGDYDETAEEVRCGATAIKPGMLIDIDATGVAVPHGTAGGVGEKAVAIEDDFQGKTVNDAYAEGDLIRYHICMPGDVVQLILNAEEVATDGVYLVSNGDGTMQVATGTEIRLFKSLEDLDLTGGVDTFIRARAL